MLPIFRPTHFSHTPWDIPSHPSCPNIIHTMSPPLRTFYEDAIRSGVIVSPVEMFVAYATQLLGYLLAMMLRIFVIAVILMPFFGLIRHARREPGVGDVSLIGCGVWGGPAVAVVP